MGCPMIAGLNSGSGVWALSAGLDPKQSAARRIHKDNAVLLTIVSFLFIRGQTYTFERFNFRPRLGIVKCVGLTPLLLQYRPGPPKVNLLLLFGGF